MVPGVGGEALGREGNVPVGRAPVFSSIQKDTSRFLFFV